MLPKKIFISFSILFLIIILSLTYCVSIQKSLSSKVLRLHVLANSNSTFDQELKLKVKDEIVNYLTPLLKDSKSLNETKKIITKNISEITNMAKLVINKYSDYNVKVSISNSKFPTKTYGNISFPAGNYEALKVEIGEAKGNNWWCVMFPPLCFTNSDAGVFDDDSNKKLKENLSSSEYAMINNASKPSVKIKFKLLEWWNS